MTEQEREVAQRAYEKLPDSDDNGLSKMDLLDDEAAMKTFLQAAKGMSHTKKAIPKSLFDASGETTETVQERIKRLFGEHGSSKLPSGGGKGGPGSKSGDGEGVDFSSRGVGSAGVLDAIRRQRGQ